VNTFSSVKNIKYAANWKNFFRRSFPAVQFASVNYCSRHLLKHFSCRSFRIMQTTDDLGMPIFGDISRTVLRVRASPLDSEPYRSPGQCFHLFGHFAVCHDLPCRLSTVPLSLNFFREPVNATWRPSFCSEILSSTVLHYIPSTDIYFC